MLYKWTLCSFKTTSQNIQVNIGYLELFLQFGNNFVLHPNKLIPCVMLPLNAQNLVLCLNIVFKNTILNVFTSSSLHVYTTPLCKQKLVKLTMNYSCLVFMSASNCYLSWIIVIYHENSYLSWIIVPFIIQLTEFKWTLHCLPAIRTPNTPIM